jgi:hypothetical protein
MELVRYGLERPGLQVAVLGGEVKVVENGQQLSDHTGFGRLYDPGTITLCPAPIVGVFSGDALEVLGAFGEFSLKAGDLAVTVGINIGGIRVEFEVNILRIDVAVL